jgi:hypothetical protein
MGHGRKHRRQKAREDTAATMHGDTPTPATGGPTAQELLAQLEATPAAAPTPSRKPLYIGASAGALAGVAFFGPAGAIIGAVVGAIAGRKIGS